MASGGTFSRTIGACLARLCVVLGREDEARERFERTEIELEGFAAPYWQARNQMELADLLGRSADSADRTRAGQLVATARALAERYEMAGISRQADRVASSLV